MFTNKPIKTIFKVNCLRQS